MIAPHGWQAQAFNALVKQQSCAIICLLTDGTILEFNPLAESIFGWRYAEVLYENFYHICKENKIDQDIHFLQEVVKSKSVQTYISVIANRKGEKILSWTAYPLSHEGENYILLFGNDITCVEEFKQNNNKLNAYLYNIINNLPHYIFWKDTHSVFQGCNKIFADSTYARLPADVIGRTDKDMPWGKYAEKYWQDDQNIMHTGVGKLNYEEPHVDADGKEMVVLASKVPMYDDNHNIIGLLGIYTDITERKQIEESLRIAKDEAETANQMKRDFINNLEHDIRTPFSGIYSMIDALGEMETDPQKKIYLTDVKNCAKELLEYSNSILNFSKLESGLIPLISKKFNLKKLVSGIFAIETPPAKMKKLDLIMEYATDVPEIVVGDQYRLQRILINLMSNSIKFTLKGHVKLSVKLAAKTNKDCIIRISVEDTGIGIPEDEIIYIYEKFHRLTPANKNIFKGSGLGLPTVKQLMEELQGELDVSSKLNVGTVFVCTIPFNLPLINEVLFEDT